MTTTNGRTMGASALALLGVYLNDHLAGSTGGLALFRRVARAHRGSVVGTEVARLAAEVAQDRAALIDVMRALGIPRRRYKTWLVWVAEKAGRLKLNGRLVRRSPLSTLVELEALRLGVQGKDAGWTTLRTLAERDDRLSALQLDALLDRAHRQAQALEELRVGATAEIFGRG